MVSSQQLLAPTGACLIFLTDATDSVCVNVYCQDRCEIVWIILNWTTLFCKWKMLIKFSFRYMHCASVCGIANVWGALLLSPIRVWSFKEYVSSNCLLERMHTHTGCSCLTFLQGVFSNCLMWNAECAMHVWRAGVRGALLLSPITPPVPKLHTAHRTLYTAY